MEALDRKYWGYRAYKGYALRFLESIIYRRFKVDGLENLPKQGERMLLISNHQNSASDALLVIQSLPRHLHPFVVARGDVFWVHPLITKFFLWIGMLPAFRLDFEGGDSLEKNKQSFDLIARYINEGYPVAVFPTAGHMRGHTLGGFTTGYLKMAFQAAEANGWQEDIKIVPMCNHYTSYEGLQGDALVRIGKPVSLKPYYDDYREHPYPTLRKLNHLFLGEVGGLMVNLDEEHLWALDWIRTSELGDAAACHLDDVLARLKSDQRYMAKVTEKANANPKIYELAQWLSDWREEYKIPDQMIHPDLPSWGKVTLSLMVILVAIAFFFPVLLLGLWPHAINYWLPAHLRRNKTADFTWTNSYRMILSIIALLPIEALLTILVMGFGFGMWWQSILYVVLWPLTGRLMAKAWNFANRTFSRLWVLQHPNEIAEYNRVRAELVELLKS